MIVLKAFKNVNQVFKVGDEIYENIEGLEHWVAREFVGLETFVTDALAAAPVAAPSAVVEPVVVATPVPAAPPVATPVPVAPVSPATAVPPAAPSATFG